MSSLESPLRMESRIPMHTSGLDTLSVNCICCQAGRGIQHADFLNPPYLRAWKTWSIVVLKTAPRGGGGLHWLTNSTFVPGRVGLAVPFVRVLQAHHVLLKLGGPAAVVTLVKGVDLAQVGHLEVGVGEDKLPDHAVVREAVHALADGEHEDGG